MNIHTLIQILTHVQIHSNLHSDSHTNDISLVNSLTYLTVNTIIAIDTDTDVPVDVIYALASIQTRHAITLLDVCREERNGIHETQQKAI